MRYLFLVFTILLSKYIFGQNDSVDYIALDYDSLTLVDVNMDNNESHFTIYLIEKGEISKYQYSADLTSKSDIIEELEVYPWNIFEAKDLTSLESNDLNNRQFKINSYIGYEVFLNFLPNNQFSYKAQWDGEDFLDDSKSEYEILKINGKTTFIFSHENGQGDDALGLVFKQGEKYAVYFDGDKKISNGNKDYKNYYKQLKKASNFERILEIVNDGRLFGVKNTKTKKIIIPFVYDSIIKVFPIVAYQRGKVDIFNVEGDKLFGQSFKSAYQNREVVQLLSFDNEIFYTNLFENLTKEPEQIHRHSICLTGVFDRQIELNKDNKGNYYYIDDYFDAYLSLTSEIIQKVDSSSFDEEKLNIQFKKVEDSLKQAYKKTLTFSKDYDTIYVAEKNRDILKLKFDSTLIARKNNKFFIYQIQNKKLKLKGENYDQIENIKNIYLKLKRNNLYCYYPISNKPKFMWLGDFVGSLARYQKPDLSEGWLDINGNEFPD